MSRSTFVFRQFALGLTSIAALGAQAPDTAGTDIVATRGEVTADGKVLRYTAHAGHIGIRDNEAGDVHGNMFFVAYTLDRAPGTRPRPLTFVWNGGPGSNSGLVHLLGFGPKRITAATGSMPRFSPWGTALVDNQDTWLAHTDLVFVDPVGTGYSRPTKPEYASEFYQGRGDAESVAEFIRLYRMRFDAFDAPLFIAGESYGVTRASLVADALERRRTNLSGVILLSGGFPLSETPPVLRNALSLPTLTAAAFINHKLPADLQSGDLLKALHAAESYAQTEYAAALARRDSLSAAEKDAVVAQLARFTGLTAGQIDRNTLRVTTDQLSNAAHGAAGGWAIRQPDARSARHGRSPIRSDNGPESQGHSRSGIGRPLHAQRARLQERFVLPGSVRWRLSAGDDVPRRLDVRSLESRRADRGRRCCRAECGRECAAEYEPSVTRRDEHEPAFASARRFGLLRSRQQLLRDRVCGEAFAAGPRAAGDGAQLSRRARGLYR